MLLTLKNKIILGIENVLNDAEKKGGIPKEIIFDPQEAADFLQEIRLLDEEDRRDITIKQVEDGDPNVRFLLKSELTKELIQFLMNKWYVGKISFYYKDVKMRIVKPKKLDVPEPIFPPSQILREGDTKEKCPICGSSMHKKLFRKPDGCIQPQCKNYYLLNK